MPKEPCNNCKTTSWAAKNDNFCTKCECDWYDVFKRTQLTGEEINPKQEYADEIMKQHGQ